jgi:hypothetical protein
MIQQLPGTIPSLRRTREEQAAFVNQMEALGLGDSYDVEVARRRVAALDRLISDVSTHAPEYREGAMTQATGGVRVGLA